MKRRLGLTRRGATHDRRAMIKHRIRAWFWLLAACRGKARRIPRNTISQCRASMPILPAPWTVLSHWRRKVNQEGNSAAAEGLN